MQNQSGNPLSTSPGRGWQSLGLIAGGLFLYWLSLPPVGWSWCAWLVFVPWTIELSGSPESGRPARAKSVWFVAWIFWLAVLYFIPIPHPALFALWPLMCAYLACYPLLFFVVSRRLVHTLGLSPVLVLPAVWVSIEWIRNWLLTGFGMAMLAHSQYRQEWIMPIAAIGGAYLVSLLVAMVGVGIGGWFVPARPHVRWAGTGIAALGIAATVLAWSMQPQEVDPNVSPLSAAVVQGSIDTEFPATEAEAEQIAGSLFLQYRELTIEARRKWPDVELIIWPETIFPATLILDSPDTNASTPEWRAVIQSDNSLVRRLWRLVTGMATVDPESDPEFDEPIAMMTGVPAQRVETGQSYNSAMLLDGSGNVTAVYHKNHRVIFGEYSPVTGLIPSLEKFIAGIDAGTNAGRMEFRGCTMMPEICFETTVPHLVRRHWLELEAEGKSPDCIVCLTNDGWFFGTSCLDFHLACNVFRAAETQTPLIVAANTGFSAEISKWGRIVQQGPRRATGIMRVRIEPGHGKKTLWLVTGDWPWRISCLAVIAGFSFSFRKHKNSRRRVPLSNPDPTTSKSANRAIVRITGAVGTFCKVVQIWRITC